MRGTFNDVDFTCDCPICGQKVTGFQTKDYNDATGNLECKTVDYWLIDNFYSSCSYCGADVEYIVKERPFNPISNYQLYIHANNIHANNKTCVDCCREAKGYFTLNDNKEIICSSCSGLYFYG
jgi:endogenous inhibitor of DNA gyrase (YacG/DUF329 family)